MNTQYSGTNISILSAEEKLKELYEIIKNYPKKI